jgi:hypothetical protein
MQTCVKILKFTFLLILKLFFTLVHYMFWLMRLTLGASKIAVEICSTSVSEMMQNDVENN